MQWPNVLCRLWSSDSNVLEDSGRLGWDAALQRVLPDLLCLFLYDVIHLHTNSFIIFPEIINALAFLLIVYIAHVAVHIILRCWGRDFAVSVLNRLHNLRSRNREFDSGQRHKFFSHPLGQALTQPSTQLAPKALSRGANGRRVKLATRLHLVPMLRMHLTELYIWITLCVHWHREMFEHILSVSHARLPKLSLFSWSLNHSISTCSYRVPEACLLNLGIGQNATMCPACHCASK